jgi:hypothetical protein
MSLKNKATVITDGNSGIGKVIVLELTGPGADIATEYVSHLDATDELEKQIAALGDQAIGADGRTIDITSVHEDWPLTGNTSDCVSKGGIRAHAYGWRRTGTTQHPSRRLGARSCRHSDQPLDDAGSGQDVDAG